MKHRELIDTIESGWQAHSKDWEPLSVRQTFYRKHIAAAIGCVQGLEANQRQLETSLKNLLEEANVLYNNM